MYSPSHGQAGIPTTNIHSTLRTVPGLYENVLLAMLYGNNGSNKSPTRCNNFPVYYPDVYLQLNMFWAFSRPSSGAQ
jgi:hypothetical protein